MLFNSLEFILFFLPLTLLLWRLTLVWGGLRPALGILVASSLFFYGWWHPAYLPGLVALILLNFHIGRQIIAARAAGRESLATRWLRLGLVFDLTVLGVFKYAYFIADTVAVLGGWHVPFAPLLLPLGLSFITFQQLAYLIDCRRGQVRDHGVIDYLVFVSFFPQLIAGPIVHHQPLIAQLTTKNPLLLTRDHWPSAITLFALGLYKKVILADTLGHYATPVFAAAALGPVSGDLAWQGMLAYSLQLYFDFSGYSDMALGLGLLFGLKLPVNFDSPYRARSISDFWRRWNITLSHCLRDYVYIPLGGNRQGARRRQLNLLITMLLGGLWHGAGWTFILWGGLHGGLLIINHAWRDLCARSPRLATFAARVPAAVWIGLTFLVVALAWVPFRAPSIAATIAIYAGLRDLGALFAAISTAPWWPTPECLQGWLDADPAFAWAWIALGLIIVWGLPTGWRWVGYDPQPNRPLNRRPGVFQGIITGLLLWLALKTLLTAPASEFLYFNF
ncbi:MAG: MBOAT family O-acyltransferase [Thermochromatium sp.]